jgi:hypothetical protein
MDCGQLQKRLGIFKRSRMREGAAEISGGKKYFELERQARVPIAPSLNDQKETLYSRLAY